MRFRIPDLDYCVMIITFVVWRKNARDNFGLMMQCVAYHDQDEYLLLHIWKLREIRENATVLRLFFISRENCRKLFGQVKLPLTNIVVGTNDALIPKPFDQFVTTSTDDSMMRFT